MTLQAPQIDVTAVIPTYNRAATLKRAIDSVLAQTVRVSDIIVVDDGSTDDTKSLLACYGNQVRYLYQSNRGVAAARNLAMREATTTWIAFLDSDDEWLPEKTAAQAEALATQAAEVCYGPYWHHDLRGGVVLSVPVTPMLPKIRLGNVFPPSVAMVSRAALVRHGGFREDLRGAEDWELFCRMAQDCRFLNVSTPLLRYHETESSLCLDPAIMLPASLSMIDSLLIGLRQPAKAVWRQRILGSVYHRMAITARERRGPALRYILLSLLRWPAPDVRVKILALELLDIARARMTPRRP